MGHRARAEVHNGGLEGSLRQILEGLGATTGQAFFRALVEHLARVLDVGYATVAEADPANPGQVHCAAHWAGGRLVEIAGYELAYTPCARVVRGETCVVPQGLREAYPRDAMLHELAIESYVGVPLSSGDGAPLGLLAIMDGRPLPDAGAIRETLQLFAPRAGAELARLRAERELRARDERLARQTQTLLRLAAGNDLEGGDLDLALREIDRAAAETLDVHASGVWLFDETGTRLACRDLYARGCERSEDPALGLHQRDAPRYFESLARIRCIDAHDVVSDPRTRELAQAYFAPRGIASTLDAPIRLGGRVVGVQCHEQLGSPRRWTSDEQTFAASLADLVAFGLEAAQLRRTQLELSARNRGLMALNRIAELTLAAQTPDDALERAIDEVAEVTGFPQVWLHVQDPLRRVLRLAAERGPCDALPPELAQEACLAGAVVEGARPIVLQDAQLQGRAEAELRAGAKLATYVGLPLLQGQRAVGVLGLGALEPRQVDSVLIDLGASLATALASLADRLRAREQAQLLEDQLRQAHKLEAIGTLAGGVAHDFNNLLTGILGYTYLLKQSAEPASDVYRAAAVIENAAERAAELTRQLLGFARQGKLRNVPVDLHAVVRDVTGLLARTLDKSIVVGHALCAPRAHVLGDPGQMHQVLLNLAINARDAMPGGGRIDVSTQLCEARDVPRREHPELKAAPHVMLAVRDTGSGIPRDVLGRIFEPFFTTKEQGKGSGMGLAMVYGIVQAHGGAIDVQSEEGVGTTFRILLPLADAAEAGPPQRAPTATPDAVRGSGTVLVVDDEELVRAMAAELLTSLGYEVLLARNGLEAVDLYLEHRGRIDLVLLDLVMPRMGGHECLRALKRIDSRVRVLLSSGWQQVGSVQNALDDGALGFLSKPYQLGALSDAVAKALARNRPRPLDFRPPAR